jgi:hypothetical protein
MELHGLKAKPELNGQRGVVTGFDAASGRRQVQLLERAESFSLKAENLVLVDQLRGPSGDLSRASGTDTIILIESSRIFTAYFSISICIKLEETGRCVNVDKVYCAAVRVACARPVNAACALLIAIRRVV